MSLLDHNGKKYYISVYENKNDIFIMRIYSYIHLCMRWCDAENACLWGDTFIYLCICSMHKERKKNYDLWRCEHHAYALLHPWLKQEEDEF